MNCSLIGVVSRLILPLDEVDEAVDKATVGGTVSLNCVNIKFSTVAVVFDSK